MDADEGGEKAGFFYHGIRNKDPLSQVPIQNRGLLLKRISPLRPSASLCVAAVETLAMVRVFYISRLNLPVLLVSAFPLLSAVPSAMAL
jgi:hypothetical protein